MVKPIETVTFLGRYGGIVCLQLFICDWSIQLFYGKRKVKQNSLTTIVGVQRKFDESKVSKKRKNDHFHEE